MEILQTDTLVRATANRGKNYTVVFRAKAPILVQVNFRSRHGSGEEYAGYRTLWQKGDGHLSLTAHCAINAAKAEILCSRCGGDGYLWTVRSGFNPFRAGGFATARASQKTDCYRCKGTGMRADEQGTKAGGKT